MSRKGNCYDNCIMETFFGRMKNQMFYGHEKEYSSFETFAKAVDGYINYYNNERIQEKTKWINLQNSERHPCAPNSIFYVSRILGTYQTPFLNLRILLF